MTPAQIYELVRAIDSDGDGLISLADFRSAFQLEGDDADGGGGDAGGGDAVGDAPRDSQPGDDGGGEIQIAAKTIRELHDARAPGGAGGGGAPIGGVGGVGGGGDLNVSAVLASLRGPLGRNLTRWQRRALERERARTRERLRFAYDARDYDSDAL